MRRAFGSLFAVLALASCSVAPPVPPSGAACLPTIAHMRPPDEVIDFYAAGANPPVPRQNLFAENWYGNDAMWLALPPRGEVVGRLDDKIPPYRLKRGHVQYEARRLDGVGTVSRQPLSELNYGDIGFQSGGPRFPNTGCWAVTYVLDGAYPLEFVLSVR
jgi:hypothetical protein